MLIQYQVLSSTGSCMQHVYSKSTVSQHVADAGPTPSVAESRDSDTASQEIWSTVWVKKSSPPKTFYNIFT